MFTSLQNKHPGEDTLSPHPAAESGAVAIVRAGDDDYVVIDDFDRLPPFFCTLASDADLWVFISSTGSLTAGRSEPDNAILPYETVDKIHTNGSHTGPLTLLRWYGNGRLKVWEPFRGPASSSVRRRLMKNLIGSRMVFEESLLDEGLTFSATFKISDRFGLVRECSVHNSGTVQRSMEILHGVRNLIPWGVSVRLQNEMSCLTDAYKQNEILSPSGPGIYSMASGITDKPVPCESLRATIVWSCGLPDPIRSVEASFINRFIQGDKLARAHSSRGVRGHYLETSAIDLGKNEKIAWSLVADAAVDQSTVSSIEKLIATGTAPGDLSRDIIQCEARLRQRLAAADAFQTTADTAVTAHHIPNVLFNIMRGGTFSKGYAIDGPDFSAFVAASNRGLGLRHADRLKTLPVDLPRETLREMVRSRQCPQLERLFFEYLPIGFSRRHGDPSRPWNHFRIRIRDEHGGETLDFQGNWRDIFQNWEALALSFPEYLESMVRRFVNASTVDGHNPYRIARDGIDWEEPEAGNPWASFGYWGDHQIIYLLKLLEAFEQHDPGAPAALLAEKQFTYANVPYRIKAFDEILLDPRDTIAFDAERSRRLREQSRLEGSDAKLLSDEPGMPALVTLMEKLLVPVLAKWSHFLPGGGIWLNTQRPEWNDANNALVGNGLSMVTLCHLRRHQAFLMRLVASNPEASYPVSTPVVTWLESLSDTLASGDPETDASSPRRRHDLLLALGRAGETYRELAYKKGFTGATKPLRTARILNFLRLLQEWTDPTIRMNRRPDGLFHAYNLMRIDGDRVEIRRLDLMLEGQVAALSAQCLAPAESADLLDSLRQSELYCPHRQSFLLYPDRPVTSFLEKNRLNAAAARSNPLLAAMLESGDGRIVRGESDTLCRFHPDLRNASLLRARLKEIAAENLYGSLPAEECSRVEALYEEVFQHHGFTGRSGSMFAYEGLGSIYWHMVSKLLLATQECLAQARFQGAAAEVCRRLDGHYDAIRDGLGFRKTARAYGAFPTDPYSHSPAYAGAQQPGMTGQVKEEILTRRGELGVWVRDGCVTFFPIHDCLQRELLSSEAVFEMIDLKGTGETFLLPPGAIGYTLCQTPVICAVQPEGRTRIRIHYRDGNSRTDEGAVLSRPDSKSLFRREDRIHFLEVFLASPLSDANPQPGA